LGIRARQRIAYRLLPFVFVLYLVAYIDRVNVSFASLRMNADLGFSDSAFGLGSGIFYISYVLFEVPGAIIVERWSARKWIRRIMVSWGLVTILTGFVHTAGQFYVARFLLGLAESSFFPGMIIYLTRWFCLSDRSRAIACLYAANPTGQLGGLVEPWSIGALSDRTHSLTAAFAFIALSYLLAGTLILSVRVRDPIGAASERRNLQRRENRRTLF
jgi:ACS family tartrate transporter-like MFS transporter